MKETETELTDDASLDHQWVSTAVEEMRVAKLEPREVNWGALCKGIAKVAILVAVVIAGYNYMILLRQPAYESRAAEYDYAAVEKAYDAWSKANGGLEAERAKRLQEVNDEFDKKEGIVPIIEPYAR